MDTQFGTFDLGTYNGLMTVEDADDLAKADDNGTSLRDRFLFEAGRIFRAHNMYSRFGVVLLHKHFPCTADQRVIEWNGQYDGEDALIAQAIPFADDGSAFATAWQASDEAFRPLSYSTDPVARELSKGEVPTAFLNEYAALIRRYGVERLFGLGIIERELFQKVRVSETPLEYTDDETLSNVTLLRKLEGLKHRTSETSWRFHPSLESATDCATTCRTECWNVAPPEKGHHMEHYAHHIVRPD